MKFIVGSLNQNKIDTTERVLRELIHEELSINGFASYSGVPDTPWDKQTIDGSINRAEHCKREVADADYWIGLESGLVDRYGDIYEEAWTCVIDKSGKKYLGYSSGLKLPDYAIKKMKELHLEHGPTMKYIREEMGWRNNTDTWGTYSNNAIIRNVSLQEAVRNACIQIFTPGTLYQK